jgi:hypothetical protein
MAWLTTDAEAVRMALEMLALVVETITSAH